MNKERLLYIWRFQPFHNWHLSVIKKNLTNPNVELIVWIWSINTKYFTEKNPFSFIERKEMLRQVLWIDIKIEWIPDFPDDLDWKSYIDKKLKPDKILTWNEWVKNIFKERIVEINERYLNISSTMIRKYIVDKKDFSRFVPNVIYEYIIKNNLHKRIIDINEWWKILNNEFKNNNFKY